MQNIVNRHEKVKLAPLSGVCNLSRSKEEIHTEFFSG
jgi:hypothetical protein